MISFSSVCYHIDYIRRRGGRVVAELKPPISLAQLLPQVLAWHELECTACPAQGLAKLYSEESRAKDAFRFDSLSADVLQLG